MGFIKQLLQSFFRSFGYELKRFLPEKGYALDLALEANQAAAVVKEYTMLSTLKLTTLYEQAVHCEKQNIPGAFVECGVWKGGAVGIMAQANLKHGKKRRPLYLFDAFDDICEPDAEVDGAMAIKDVETLLGRKVTDLTGKVEPIKGIYDSRGGHGTIATCKSLIVDTIQYEEKWIHCCKGWFQESLPREVTQLGDIAILRLDADWYSSTKLCLDYLFDKVVAGGFIIIDDYGRYDGCKKAVEDFFTERNLHPFLHYADYQHGECRYFIKT